MTSRLTIDRILQISGSPRRAWKFFADAHVINNRVYCSDCKRDYTLISYSRRVHALEWRCAGCRATQSILSGSYFSGAHISLALILRLLYYWATKIPVTTAVEHLAIGTHTAVDYYQFFRDICSWKLLKSELKLGGPGVIVQIDESVMVKVKYNRGRNLRLPPRWMFGIYDSSQKLGYIVFVEKRDADTLLPIIERVVLPGSIIHSDGWAAYSNISTTLAHCNYQHRIVNHSVHFVDPHTGAHTQGVESYWKRAKMVFKRMSGTRDAMIAGYLDEVMWRERYGATPLLTVVNLLRDVRERQPC